MYYGWKPYVPVAERRRKAERELAKRRKGGEAITPVKIEGRTIARTFWGRAWCDNLEGYSDFANRLPRGRTYVRNGSVIDLKLAPGEVWALVSGSEIYEVKVTVSPLPTPAWKEICQDCSGAIDSLVELLQGRFSKGVMERICRQRTGLFPSPAEIRMSCSCPDWATMCKHVSAVLYGVGARLDEQPELLFRLRKVDEKDLVMAAGRALPLPAAPASDRVLDEDGLSDLFGLDIEAEEPPPPPPPKKAAPRKDARKTRAPPPPRKAKAPAKKAQPPASEEAAEQLAAIAAVEARVAELRRAPASGSSALILERLEAWLVDARRRHDAKA